MVWKFCEILIFYGNCLPDGPNSVILSHSVRYGMYGTATATGTQIWPYHEKVKGLPSLIILTNLLNLESPMLYTKIQPQSRLSTGEEDF